jgi:hypothetical protein
MRKLSRNTIRSKHRVEVLIQALLSSDPNVYDGPGGQIDQLVWFLQGVQDYWDAAHRQINAVADLSTGKTGVVLWDSETKFYSPKQVDTNMIWAGELFLTFAEDSQW